jgi:hypothetical protein
MSSSQNFYICPICFRVSEIQDATHEHRMVQCQVGRPGDERRKPVSDRFGHMVSRAPRWYLEAVGWIEAKR